MYTQVWALSAITDPHVVSVSSKRCAHTRLSTQQGTGEARPGSDGAPIAREKRDEPLARACARPSKRKEGDPWNSYVAPHELALLERPDTADGSASRSGLVNQDDTANVSAREP